MTDDILIVGSGGHARSVSDIILQEKLFTIAGCIDNLYEKCANIKFMEDILIIGNDGMLSDFYKQGLKNIFIAIGENRMRTKLYNIVSEIGFTIVNVVSNASSVSQRAHIGNGVCIMHGAVVNINTVIGNNCIINTKCSLDHDCCVGDNCHIAPGVTVSGGVHIGNGVQLGTGTSVIDGVKIGENSFIGAGSVIVNDIPSGVMAYGVPARIVRTI
ncbi:MAG: acetyltransferase [Bacteroidales bacterium]|jgi:UDP-perosamine 4-acetyltransferase|nr:acetyltransferase [Bacteroidales bacterium]